jgi:hypothetical protein
MSVIHERQVLHRNSTYHFFTAFFSSSVQMKSDSQKAFRNGIIPSESAFEKNCQSFNKSDIRKQNVRVICNLGVPRGMKIHFPRPQSQSHAVLWEAETNLSLPILTVHD